jgi:MraZ protein
MSTLLHTLFGRKEYRIDPKGRIPLSADYYSQLDVQGENKTLVVVRSSNGGFQYLEVFSLKEWKEKLEIIDRMDDDDDKEWLLVNYVGGALQVDLDGQNRIRLPKSWIDYAGINKDVVFIGAISTIRIWSKESLEKYEMIPKGAKDSIREKMNAARRKLLEERGNR